MLIPKTIVTLGSLLLIATLFGAPVWKVYLQGGFLFYFTLILAPFILYVRQPKVASIRYAFASMLSLLAHLLLGANIFFLAGYFFFILFLIEWKWGKLNDLSIYWIFILSPLTVFLFGVFSFPIRLELSKMATWLLSFILKGTQCQGNLILIEGTEFSVDEACMGLKMVSYSYLAMLVFISHFEKVKQQQISKFIIASIMAIGTLLILAANLVRIVAIILFRAMPETLEHDLIGLICWILYVILPSYFLIKFVISKQGINWVKTETKQFSNKTNLGLIIGCLSLLAIGGYKSYAVDTSAPSAKVNFAIEGFSKSNTVDGVIKIENEEALIYIKPSCSPFRSDHAPNICWKGSGYEFNKEKEVNRLGIDMIQAELNKGKDKLYTAWWYDNGLHQTNSQFEWRWNAICGQGGYQLINVSAESPELLDIYIKKVALMKGKKIPTEHL